MVRGRPAVSGYAKLAQAEDDEYSDASEEEEHLPASQLPLSDPRYGSLQPSARGDLPGGAVDGEQSSARPRRRRRRRNRAHSGVDIHALNVRLERWAEEIASKFKIRRIKGKTEDEERLEIHHSVFQAPEGIRPANAEALASQFVDKPEERMTKIQFDDVVESVKVAIELGVHPKLISQGSSGSYFARNSDGKVVGVFKPKDEEPYASRNPKWTKWIHRNLFPFAFGRACLIPNLSYVSEAAAYVLDTRLQTNIVPYTDVVYLSSPAFYYDYWERRNFYRRKKALPQKPGSLQVFLKGFKDATLFLREHPWPDQASTYLAANPADKRKRRRGWTDQCRPGAGMSDDEEGPASARSGRSTSRPRPQFWSEELQQSFREELEKLVILDYIMRNTDRGLDNWMIRVDEETQKATIIADVPKSDMTRDPSSRPGSVDPYGRRNEPMNMGSPTMTATDAEGSRKAVLGAIDNSLSWPWKHPDAWRSYPFGWLFLPVSLIGRPFSEKTRQHFLPLLTSKQWWSDTQVALRRVFSQDSDFKERMFARQIAVMKGQAWNVVETLKLPDHGPLELTRRARVCVWDDLVDIPVAVPMRTPSEEQRRRRHDSLMRAVERGEGDISTMNSKENGLTADAGYMPNSNRFGLSPSPGREPRRMRTENNITVAGLSSSGPRPDQLHERPSFNRSRSRASLDESRSRRPARRERKRTFSFTARRVSDHEDENDGDLGFAAARDMEGNRRKVIVERLEMVKSKPPVFTWC